jgi:hypothetical protein
VLTPALCLHCLRLVGGKEAHEVFSEASSSHTYTLPELTHVNKPRIAHSFIICLRLSVQARVAAAVQELPPTPRQQMLAQQAAAASQQLPTVITRLPEQFSAQVSRWGADAASFNAGFA